MILPQGQQRFLRVIGFVAITDCCNLFISRSLASNVLPELPDIHLIWRTDIKVLVLLVYVFLFSKRLSEYLFWSLIASIWWVLIPSGFSFWYPNLPEVFLFSMKQRKFFTPVGLFEGAILWLWNSSVRCIRDALYNGCAQRVDVILACEWHLMETTFQHYLIQQPLIFRLSALSHRYRVRAVIGVVCTGSLSLIVMGRWSDVFIKCSSWTKTSTRSTRFDTSVMKWSICVPALPSYGKYVSRGPWHISDVMRLIRLLSLI